MSTPKPRQQLLLVKDLYREAEEVLALADQFSTSKGILFLDLAVEQMLLTVLTSLTTKVTIPKGELKWEPLWQTAADIMAEHGHTLPGKVSLKNLHQDRNRVQHAGSTFHFTQGTKYVGPVQHMLATVFLDGFGIDFDNFREWDLVGNGDLRNWLMKYEDHLKADDPVGCIAGCTVAYKSIIDAVQMKTKGYSSRRTAGDRVKRYSSADFGDYMTQQTFIAVVEEFEDLQRAMDDRLEMLETEVLTIGIGMPVVETRRFLQSSDGVFVGNFGGGKLEVALGGWTEKEEMKVRATFMLNYLSRLIRLVEEGYPGALDNLKF